MLNNKWFKVSVAIISIVVMVIWASNHQIEKKRTQENGFHAYSLIEKLIEVSNGIDSEVLKSTLYNIYNNDQINEILDLCFITIDEIKNSALYTTSSYPKTQKILDTCVSFHSDRIKNIDLFKRKNGQVKNSLTFITSNLDKLDFISKESQKKLFNVVSKLYAIRSSMQVVDEQKIDLDFLKKENVQNGEDKLFIELFVTHIKHLNKNLPLLIELTDEILDDGYRKEKFIKLKETLELENNLAYNELDQEFFVILIFTFITLIIIIYYIFRSESEKNRIYELQKEYRKSITIDKTTGLKNRNAYVEDVQQSSAITLVLIDITEFSAINMLYGIEAGDFVLKSLGDKIEGFVNEFGNMNLYKVGADQFALAIRDCQDDKALQLAENIIHYIESEPFKYDNIDQPIYLQLQAGISSKAPYLINCATALKTITGNHNIKVGVFDDSLDQSHIVQKNIQMIQKIKSCIAHDNVTILFQPIIDLKTKEVAKFEALVRLRDQDEFISPYFFLDLSKKAKMYTQITHDVFTKSLEAVKEKDIDISINLSIEDILHQKTYDFIINSLEKNQRLAKRVTFELLESEEIQDFNALKVFIEKVKSFGSQIAIDDFGSGYSNYNYLLELDIDILKIDGSLIKNIDKSENNQLVVRSIVEFAKIADIKTIAEFVENKEIEKVVTELGIDFGQGYYYSAPKLL